MASPATLGIITLAAILEGNGVLAYYCDSDKCSEDEYCCGVNICCTSNAVWQMWYFWCGIAMFVVLLMACAGLCRYKYQTSTVIILRDKPLYARLHDPDYVYTDAKGIPFPEDHFDKKNKGLLPATFTSPPPQYSQHPPVQGLDKDPTYKR